MQKAIHVLPVPLSGADGVALLGLDGEQIVAVVVWCSISGEPDLYKIRLMAIAREHRTPAGRRAGALARAALAEALTRISTSSPGATVFGLVDHRNRASKRVLQDAGFAQVNGPVADSELEMWAARLPIA